MGVTHSFRCDRLEHVRLNGRCQAGLALLTVLTLPAACGGNSGPSTSNRPNGDGCEYVPAGQAARPVEPPSTGAAPASGISTFVLKTTEGNVSIRMDRSKAPCTVHSFESLAKQGYFDQTRCHRLTDSSIFVLQCGDPTGTGTGGPGYSFANETSGTESYTRGVVAMANAGPNTNGSQFFLVYDDSTNLDRQPNYTIFGRLDATAIKVVARIAEDGHDGSNPDGTGRPNNPAEIITVTKR